MSNSSEIKGRKGAKKNNLVANKEHRKHIPYGSKKKFTYDSDEDLVNIVNKAAERRKNRNIEL